MPFFSAPLVDLSVQWHALIFEHAAVGNIEMHRAKMNLVNGPTPETRQTEVDAPWAQKIKQLFPLKINRFAVHDGEIHYRDFTREPSVDVPFDQVQIVGINLTNSKKLSKTLIADIRIEGRPLRAGDARAQISLDPYAPRPTFALNLEVKELPLVKLNDFAQAHGISGFATHGESHWLSMSYLAGELDRAGVAKLIIAALTDYDPWGFAITDNIEARSRIDGTGR